MVMMHFASVFVVVAALSVAEAQTTCTASWAMITDPPQKYADGVSLALYKSHATLSDPAQPPLGWDSGTPALTGYVVSHLGATLDAFEVWTQTEGFWYYIRTTAAYPPGSGSLTLTYPCAPPPTCTASWAMITDPPQKYADGVSLALYKSHATLSDPAQPPLGWDSGTPALTGYVVSHLGATLVASEVWTQTEGYWYYIRTTAAYPPGSGSLTLTYPCATPAPTPAPPPPPTPLPPTPSCTATWDAVDSSSKYADGVSLALYKSHATLSIPAQPPLGWDSGTPALTGYVITHLGATLDASEVWTQTEGFWYYIKTTAAYPSGTGSLTLTYPCAG